MTELDLIRLREIAEAATPGPWRRYGLAGVAFPDGEIVAEQRIECDGCGEPVALTSCDTRADATHIAAFDPPTVLALLAEIEGLTHRNSYIESERRHLIRENESLQARIDAAKTLHQNGGKSQGWFATGGQYGEHDSCCTECGEFGEYGIKWPCPTLQALEGGDS